MFTEAVADRLETEVAALEHRTKRAADLSEMIRQKELPQSPVSAFVISAGLRPISGGESITGAYTQELSEVIAIVLVVRTAGDVGGGKSLPTLEELIEGVTRAIVGWAPEGAEDSIYLPIGDFGFERGQLVQLDAGVMFYQLEFGCPVQLRIIA